MAQVTIGPQTLGSMKAMVTRYHKEKEDGDLLNDAVNDAIESLWRNILLVSLGSLMGAGPVTNLTIAAGSERATIVSIADPTAGPSTATFTNGDLPPRDYDIAFTFVTESGSETLRSPVIEQSVNVNDLASAQVTSQFPTGALGWNIYVGPHGAPLGRQNAEPLAPSTTWQEPATGIQVIPDVPPIPVMNTTGDNIFYIRVLQVQNPDGTWTTWKAGDLDGLLFQRANRSIAAASTYQPYAYDIVNGSTVEIRPALGQNLNPRYFFVVKPRRLLYDNASLPFPNISCTEFLKAYAEAELDLSNKEFTSYSIKSKKAAGILQEIVQGLNTQSTTKQKSIVPYFSW